jgi:hypothetical protein
MQESPGSAVPSAASAAVTYQYTGSQFDTSHWNPAFGPPPTHMTVTVQVANPFPQDPNFAGGWVGSVASQSRTGVISATVSDGVRTFTPKVVFLKGYGTEISEWLIGGGLLQDAGSSDTPAIATANITARGQTRVGDLVSYQLPNGSGHVTATVRNSVVGQWTVVG